MRIPKFIIILNGLLFEVLNYNCKAVFQDL